MHACCNRFVPGAIDTAELVARAVSPLESVVIEAAARRENGADKSFACFVFLARSSVNVREHRGLPTISALWRCNDELSRHRE